MEEAGAGPSQGFVNPWPHLASLFTFSEQVGDSFRFKCLLCLPKQNFITAYKNSTSNLRKHVKVRTDRITKVFEYMRDMLPKVLYLPDLILQDLLERQKHLNTLLYRNLQRASKTAHTKQTWSKPR